jgi:hypothetical protein
MGALYFLEAAFLPLLLYVAVACAVPRYVAQPVDGVKVVILANPWRKVLQGVHQIRRPCKRSREAQDDSLSPHQLLQNKHKMGTWLLFIRR